MDENNVQQKKSGNKIGRIVLLAIAAVCLIVYFAVPAVHTWVNNVVTMFRTGNFDDMRAFISKYGPWAMLVSSLLMIFQSLAAPLPAFFITLTNANLFGWWQGCILSWASSMAGAALCFWIARILGRDVVEKICSKRGLESIEEFFDKYGKRCILVARLLPFISFDIVSYAAGLTSMGFVGFFVATGLGQLPACIVYSYVGGMLTGGAKKLFIGLMCLFALAIVVILVKQVYSASQKKKELAAAEAGEVFVREPSNHARLWSKLYCAALWAMVLVLLCANIPKIATMMNIGWTYFALLILIFVVALCFKKFKCGVRFTALSTVVGLLLIWLICGDALSRKPAGIIRMGIGVRTVPFATINYILIALLVLGFVLSVLLWKRQGRIQAEYEKALTDAELNAKLKAEADKESESNELD